MYSLKTEIPNQVPSVIFSISASKQGVWVSGVRQRVLGLFLLVHMPCKCWCISGNNYFSTRGTCAQPEMILQISVLDQTSSFNAWILKIIAGT